MLRLHLLFVTLCLAYVSWAQNSTFSHQKEMEEENNPTLTTEAELYQNSSGKLDEWGYKIVGYFPSWSGSVSNIPFEKLTHINYSFLLPDKDKGIKPIENLSKMKQLVEAGHENEVFISIAIGGWNGGDDSHFEVLAADSAKTVMFVDSVMAFVERYNLDGVDMDWEYPESGQSASNYVSMMSLLSKRLKEKGKLLTAAVVAKEWDKYSIKDSVFTLVDWLNLMAYDNYSASNHSTYEYAEASLNYWVKHRGLPKEKAVLGVPFYGYKPYTAYKTIVYKYPDAPYADNKGSYYYNGRHTIYRKTALAMQEGAGIMCWELSQDTKNEKTSLLHVMYATIALGYTDIEEQIQADVLMYPNPAQSTVNIQWEYPDEVLEIKVYNQMGQCVLVESKEPLNGLVELELASLKDGIYFLKIDSGTRQAKVKLVKE